LRRRNFYFPAHHNLNILSISSFVVSVAGCLGYDVLERRCELFNMAKTVSVAGCLGYDVLAHISYHG
jgi:quinol monooxygenase YgiN